MKKCAASKGWNVEIWSNKVLAESLDRCQDNSDPNVNFLLRSLATYAMVQAVYFSTGSVSAEEWVRRCWWLPSPIPLPLACHCRYQNYCHRRMTAFVL